MADDKKVHELEIQVTKNVESLKSSHKRLDELNKEISTISSIALSVKEIAIEMREMRKDVSESKTEVTNVKNRVREIENIPTKRYNTLIDKVISIIIGCVIGYIMSGIGL